MGITLTTAPCCWGVDDLRNPDLPPWERVFDEVAAAGYGGLTVVAGALFADLVSLSNREGLLSQRDEQP